MHEHAQQAAVIRVPVTAQGCRDRMAVLQDEIASIRIQIATTDIRRQVEKKSLDPTWYHRAKTALRLKQQELAQVSARLGQLSTGNGATRRDRFKDALIEVLRADCDEERWAQALSRAREFQASEEDAHG